LLAGLGLALVLAAISILVSRPAVSGGGMNFLTRFFLVALRLSIGWHFFVEGMDKIQSPTWSSEPYLREATGPLAPRFRELAGDRLIDKLTLGRGDAFPADLELEWQGYLNAVTRFYDLTAEQQQQAKAAFDEAKAKTTAWLKTTPKKVQKIAEYPPPLMVSMTIPERLHEYQELETRLRETEEDELPRYGPDAFAKLKTAKANLAKWRAELKADLDAQTTALKQALRDKVLVPSALDALPPEYRPKPPNAKEPVTLASLQTAYHQVLLKNAQGGDVKLSPQAVKVFDYAIEKKAGKQDPNEIVPPSLSGGLSLRPVSSWRLLDWSDFLVKWGILVTGALLLLGLFTRTACLAGALLLLSFFLAMPPLPGWPESPRAEGHYLFINKNIIEMLALLTLATTASGRWVGLDGLVQFLRPRRWQSAPPPSTMG
jgi:uncharacterized membrane protein YphA (DoxX/SURF4 family)